MARNRNGSHRRRRGRFSFLTKLLCVLLIAGAAVAALTLFFRVQSIVVHGSARYSEAEVVAASGIQIEDNLFLLNKYGVSQTIFEKLPYVEEASINRKLPDTIVITVRECAAAAGIESADGVWLISGSGKLLERTDAVPEGCPLVTGAEPDAPAPSEALSFGEGGDTTVQTLLTLLRASQEQGIRSGIARIDLSDPIAIHLEYLGRFSVKLPWGSDVAYKLLSLQTVVEYLEGNETGEINLMADGEARFIPKS